MTIPTELGNHTYIVIVKMEYVNGAQLQLLPNATVQPFPNATLYPAVYPGFILALRICVGTTCVLSIFGGLGIVIAYACCLRPRPDDHLDSAEATRDQLRQILVFLSIADILVAWGHLWGISTYLERLHDVSSQYNTSVPSSDCSVQAVITIYGTVASFIWTVILTMLVFVLIKHQQKEKVQWYFSRKAFTTYHLLCWLVPLIEICIMARLNLLGYDTVDIGWCYVQVKSLDRPKSLAIMILCYDLWTYIAYILLIYFSLGAVYYARHRKTSEGREHTPVAQQQLRDNPNENSPLVQSGATAKTATTAKTTATVQLIVFALILIFLRSFSTILDTFSFLPKETATAIHHSWAMIVLIFAGIGDSAQGFVNAVVFSLFSEEFRDWIKEKCPCCKKMTVANDTA